MERTENEPWNEPKNFMEKSADLIVEPIYIILNPYILYKKTTSICKNLTRMEIFGTRNQSFLEFSIMTDCKIYAD